MPNFEEIDRARKLLEIGEQSTLRQIKQAYQEKAFQYHPDVAHGVPDETMKDLNWAYELLLEYCRNYNYSFDEESVAKVYPYDEYVRRSYKAWFDHM